MKNIVELYEIHVRDTDKEKLCLENFVLWLNLQLFKPKGSDGSTESLNGLRRSICVS